MFFWIFWFCRGAAHRFSITRSPGFGVGIWFAAHRALGFWFSRIPTHSTPFVRQWGAGSARITLVDVSQPTPALNFPRIWRSF
jgi:hypothetical protein